MNLTTETRIVLKDQGGKPIRFWRYEDGSTLVESAGGGGVALRAQQVDDLIRFLRPGLLPPRFTVLESPVSTGSWTVLDSTVDRLVSSFNAHHPHPEGAARAEAARLNETETQP
jgi:hypothetical protein